MRKILSLVLAVMMMLGCVSTEYKGGIKSWHM